MIKSIENKESICSICSICLDEISEQDDSNIYIKCSNNHKIHHQCMKTWIIISNKKCCPAGCGEHLCFDHNNLLLEEIDVTTNNKNISVYNDVIYLLEVYIHYNKLILLDIAKIHPKKYSVPINILSDSSPYKCVIDLLQELIDIYTELKLNLIQLNNIKNMISIQVNSDIITSLLNSKREYEKVISNMRETIIKSYTISKLEEIKDIVNLKIAKLSNPTKAVISNKSRVILKLLNNIVLTLPILEIAIDKDISIHDTDYISLPQIVSLLSIHRIIEIYVENKYS